MNARQQATVSERLSACLGRLEEAAGVPPVSGELAPWCETISDQLSDADESFRAMLDVHVEVFEEILDVDLEMAARVKLLRETQGVLREELDQMQKEVRHALEAAAGGHPAEGDEPAQKVDELRDVLLSWVVRCRAHEKEVRTRLMEAFNRDRGRAD